MTYLYMIRVISAILAVFVAAILIIEASGMFVLTGDVTFGQDEMIIARIFVLLLIVCAVSVILERAIMITEEFWRDFNAQRSRK